MDFVIEDMSVPVSSRNNIIEKVKHEPDRESAEEWRRYLKQNRSVIVDLFQGQIKSSLTCMVCNHISNKFEPIMYLSLPVPEAGGDNARFDYTLIDCLTEFTKEEKLGESSLW
jgi:ubiquitin carboxyl-terminal hydrolase 8